MNLNSKAVFDWTVNHTDSHKTLISVYSMEILIKNPQKVDLKIVAMSNLFTKQINVGNIDQSKDQSHRIVNLNLAPLENRYKYIFS